MIDAINLGGKLRRLRYEVDDREELESMFPRPDGTPGNLYSFIAQHFSLTGSFAIQAAVVWVGLRRCDGTVTLGKTREWLAASNAAGGKLADVLRPVANVILYSGVCGFIPTIPPPGEETELGKEEPATVKAAE